MTTAVTRETIYRLDGPLRSAIGEADQLMRMARLQPGSTVLDVGAGTGYLSLPLARAVGVDGRVECVDISDDLLEVLRTKARKQQLSERISIRVAPAQSLGYADCVFDAVYSSYLLHELGEEAGVFLSEARRVLKPLGELVLADYRRIPDPERCREIESWYQAQADEGGMNELHLRFSLHDLESMLLESGFHDIRMSTWLDFHVHAVATK